MIDRLVAAVLQRPLKVLTAVMAFVVALATAGCVTCHCQPVVNGDCTCVPPPRGTTK